MEITPGRAMYSPDEELKPLRQPKTYHTDLAAGPSTLSINAAEFVPRYGGNANNLQDRLQKHQKQYLQQNYQQYQQPQQQTQQQQQHHQYQHLQQHQHLPYSNGYDNQQQQQHQQYQQTPQNINTQMASLNISNSVQDRLLRTGNNGGNRVHDGRYYYQQQQQQQQQPKHQHQRGNGGQQQDYHVNNHYHYNKNHNHHQQHQQHQHQQQHHYSRYNNQHEQQQYHQDNQQQQSSTASSLTDSANDMENIALDYLQTVIQCLNQNPGQFDSIATRFNYIFEGMENNHYVLSIAMEDIFNESTKNSNFRYMGAKLYSLLHTLNPSKDSLFHTMLKYKLEFHQEQVREYIQKKQEARVRETALFLAELYMQLRGEGSRDNIIAENIVFSLKELLSIEDNKDNIRCICLTLKLAGYDLSTDCPIAMRDIINKLEAINCQNPGKYPLANNVISLQRNNWGRKTQQAEAHFPKQIQPVRDSDEPVFYGPDGHEITAEECEFLTNGAAAFTDHIDNEEETDEADFDLDPEMDEETEKDFKLFLKQANNNS